MDDSKIKDQMRRYVLSFDSKVAQREAAKALSEFASSMVTEHRSRFQMKWFDEFWAVYPKRVAREVRALFKEFDMRFAAHLGIDIYEPPDDDGYNIAEIVSKDFWDDDAWDLNVKDD